LSPTGFRFQIAKLPQLQFFCQTVNLPAITLGEPTFGTPFTPIPIPGETLTFGDLNVQFLVDKDMLNFKALQGWMYGLGFPIEYQQYVNFQTLDQVTGGTNTDLTKNYSDATLFVLTNNNTENIIVTFKNVFPTSLESLTFTGVDTDVNYLIGNATFKFTYYQFE
jgi:hypothetical protein